MYNYLEDVTRMFKLVKNLTEVFPLVQEYNNSDIWQNETQNILDIVEKQLVEKILSVNLDACNVENLSHLLKVLLKVLDFCTLDNETTNQLRGKGIDIETLLRIN